jgi:hypothetical protein
VRELSQMATFPPNVTTQFKPGNKLGASRKGKPNRVTDIMRTLVMDAAGDSGTTARARTERADGCGDRRRIILETTSSSWAR